MSYIGRGVDAISNVEKLDNITFNGGTTYALTKSSAAFTPVGANNILISIDGVIQQGNFSVSTTNIVFDFSPTSSNTCDFVLHYGTGVLNVPADGSVSLAKMAVNSIDSDQYVDGSIDAVHLSANSVDSDAYVDGSIDAVHLSANSVDSDAYVDGSIDTAHIGANQVTGAKLNTDVISAQTALAVAPADTDEFMVSDGGVLKRIDYSLIKGGGIENFEVWHLTAAFTGNQEPITANWEISDTAGTGNSIGSSMTQSSGVFTFPSTGKWWILLQMSFYYTGDDRAITGTIHTTLNNSSYLQVSNQTTHITNHGSTNSALNCSHFFDVTNTTNCKVRFHSTGGVSNSVSTKGDTLQDVTTATFIRIGDT